MTYKPLDNPVDYILLAGQRSPGLATVTNANSGRDLQERKGFGLGGAHVVYKGIKLVKPKVILRLVTPEDFDGWEQWKPLLDRAPTGTRARAMDIWHPVLEDQGVTAVLVEDVGQLERTKEDGEWSVTISFCEYRPPMPALSTPSGSDTTTLNANELAITAREAEIADLNREVNARAARLR